MAHKKDYAVYLQHATKRDIWKTINCSSLYEVDGDDFWSYVPDNVDDWGKNKEYGRIENDKMVMYNILAMKGKLLVLLHADLLSNTAEKNLTYCVARLFIES